MYFANWHNIYYLDLVTGLLRITLNYNIFSPSYELHNPPNNNGHVQKLSKVDQSWDKVNVWHSIESTNLSFKIFPLQHLASLQLRGWCPKFATGLNIIISIVQTALEWPGCYFAKMILPWGDHFGKKTACYTVNIWTQGLNAMPLSFPYTVITLSIRMQNHLILNVFTFGSRG